MSSHSRHKRVPALEPLSSKFEQMLLYETSSFYYLIGSDVAETFFRVLKFDRRVIKPNSLEDIFTEDPLIYTKEDLAGMLEMIHEGNKASGGLVKAATAYGIVGFVKFLDCYYITLITQRRKIGCIGANDIYSIKATEIFAIKPREVADKNSIVKLFRKLNQKLNQTSSDIAESRYMGLFQFVDMTKDFYFSYDYDLTNSLQFNYLVRKNINDHSKSKYVGNNENAQPKRPKQNTLANIQDMFTWNYFQTEELIKLLGIESACSWVVPIIHGSYEQRRFSFLGRGVDVVLIARRSRYYAGTRYLKRGINVHGKVANDCEVEQILQLDGGVNATFCSLLQVRGSIPTYWSQETSVTQPKPPVVISRIDPSYLATQEHFADLIRRYNLPIIALDLVKHEERKPREVIVGKDYRQALDVINYTMPLDKQIRYIALDYTRLSKLTKPNATAPRTPTYSDGDTNSKDFRNFGREWTFLARQRKRFDDQEGSNDRYVNSNQPTTAVLSQRVDLLSELEAVAKYSLSETNFFCSTVSYLERLEILSEQTETESKSRGVLLQSGVVRTNCLDCLDRTNGGQFAVGMQHLIFGLKALGILEDTSIDPSNKLFQEFVEMYGELGDRIAVQYGGSEAHNKIASTPTASTVTPSGGGTGSSSKQGELLTSIKRYYSNAFTDVVKQDAMNVFLGSYVPSLQQVPLWDLDTDYDLHNRILYPPEPYLNQVLFIDIIKDIHSQLENNPKKLEEFNKLLSRYFIKTLDTVTSVEDIALQMGSTFHSIRSSISMMTDKPNEDNNNVTIPESVLKTIQRSEKRKELSVFSKERVIEAVERWWIDAVDSYCKKFSLTPETDSMMSSQGSSRSIKSLLPDTTLRDNGKSFKLVQQVSNGDNLPDYIQLPSKDYYNRAHDPTQLTFFDDFLSSECYTTVEIIPQSDEVLPNESRGLLTRGLVSSMGILNPKNLIGNKKKLQIDQVVTGQSETTDRNNHEDVITTDFLSKPDDYYSIINPQDYDHLGKYSSIQKTSGSKKGSNVSRSASTRLRVNTQIDESVAGPTSSSGFHIGKYVREFGMKARNLVGGLLVRKDDEDIANGSTSFDKVEQDVSKSNNFEETDFSLWDGSICTTPSNMNIFKPISSCTISQYAAYAIQGDDPLCFLNDGTYCSNSVPNSKNGKRAYEEFNEIMHDMNIDVDDVKAMEKLSKNSYITTKMQCDNQYKGLSHLDSANLVANVMFSSLNFFEKDFQNNLNELPPETILPSDKIRKPEGTPSRGRSPTVFTIDKVTAPISRNIQALSYNSKNLAVEQSLIMKDETYERIGEYCNRMKIDSGLESALIKLSHRYLFEQVIAYRFLDDKRIARQISSLSSSKLIAEYCSMFSRESIAADVNSIKFITADAPSKLNEVDNIISYLAPISSLQQEIRRKMLGLDDQQDNVQRMTNDSSQDLNQNNYFQVCPINRSASNRDYKGFVMNTTDVYVRRTDPYVVMNEAAAAKFSVLSL